MKDMTRAEASFNRANRLYRASVKVFFAFAFVMLCVIAFEVTDLRVNFTESQRQETARRDEDTAAARKRLEKALLETQRQQIVTQNYIRCVAVISLLPIEQRSAEQLDACGIPGVTDPRKLGQPATSQGSTAPNQQTPAIPPTSSQPTRLNPSQPIAAGSPPDDEPDDRSALGKLPVVGGFFNAIGL